MQGFWGEYAGGLGGLGGASMACGWSGRVHEGLVGYGGLAGSTGGC